MNGRAPPRWGWVYLLRYHRPGQMARRLWSRIRRWGLQRTRGGRWARPVSPLPGLRSGRALVAWRDRKLAGGDEAGRDERIQALSEGRFSFLHEARQLSRPVDWRLTEHSDADPLWRFHLHYHEFLIDLAAASAKDPTRSLDPAWELVREWIEANPLSDVRGLDDAWHPFCISRRVPVWILLWKTVPPSAALAPAALASLVQQIRFLAGHLESDVGGNHLLENARALALAGSFVAGAEADRWLLLARRILFRELPVQVLPHGEHYERSPMYHTQMLEALLDIADAATGLDDALRCRCREDARRMAGFLRVILHPDGEIPLLGDSVLGETAAPQQLIAAAGGAPEHIEGVQRCGSYWTWRHRGDFLVFDAGPVGADDLPAHAHSDLLTLEVSLNGQRVIVDTGVWGYRDDESRALCRSTAAHNVLQVDGGEYCDTWGRFRMGYRGHPGDLEAGRWGDFDWARASHNACRRLGVPLLTRFVACRPEGPWLILDAATGTGRHQLCSRLHFRPGISIEPHTESVWKIAVGDASWILGSVDRRPIKSRKCLYFSQFGVRQVGVELTLDGDAELPSMWGWWICPAAQSPDFQLPSGCGAERSPTDLPEVDVTKHGVTIRGSAGDLAIPESLILGEAGKVF